MQWLIKTAKLPYWEVIAAISDIDEVCDLPQLPNALHWAVTEDSWFWARQICRRLSNESAILVHKSLMAEHMGGSAHQTRNPDCRVGVHISASTELGVSIITTAALLKLQYADEQLTLNPSQFEYVKVDNIVITPKGYRVKIVLPNIWLRIVNSDIEAVCIVNFDAITVNDYIGNTGSTTNTTNRRECTTGYAYMINSTSNPRNGSRAQPIVVDDTDPMPEYIDPSVKFKSMYENYALIRYQQWEERNPDKALRARRVRESSPMEQARWDNAEEVLEAMMSANRGPAPPKFSAAKGLQSLMQHERSHRAGDCHAKAKMDTVKQSSTNHQRHQKGKHHPRSKSKNHSRHKKGRRKKKSQRKNFGWSKKAKPRQRREPQPAGHEYENELNGEVLRDRQTPTQESHLQKRLARTGGTRDLRGERARSLQQPEPVTFDQHGAMMGVKTKYAFAPGLTTTVTHREGCPRAAVSSLPPASTLPVVVPASTRAGTIHHDGTSWTYAATRKRVSCHTWNSTSVTN
jgi:hypothetical protein